MLLPSTAASPLLRPGPVKVSRICPSPSASPTELLGLWLDMHRPEVVRQDGQADLSLKDSQQDGRGDVQQDGLADIQHNSLSEPYGSPGSPDGLPTPRTRHPSPRKQLSKAKFYSVVVGRRCGVFESW